jgi:hypothetical protein
MGGIGQQGRGPHEFSMPCATVARERYDWEALVAPVQSSVLSACIGEHPRIAEIGERRGRCFSSVRSDSARKRAASFVTKKRGGMIGGLLMGVSSMSTRREWRVDRGAGRAAFGTIGRRTGWALRG